MFVIQGNNEANVEVVISKSKSESNRVLMIEYYGGLGNESVNVSNSGDTLLLKNLLKKIALTENSFEKPVEIDCGNAGTVLRFLATALSMRRGLWLLTGTERMLHRPVKALVDSLRSLGASIEYQGVEGFPPLLVKGVSIEGGSVEVDASESSQYVSSLLLAAPTMKEGLTLRLVGRPASKPYIALTIDIMKKYGAEVSFENDIVSVKNVNYKPCRYKIGGDWSSAAFWYEIVALGKNINVSLNNLEINSLQGDSVVMDVFEKLGVITEETSTGLVLRKNGNVASEFGFDFLDTPDLFPAVAATCAGLGVKSTFTGLSNLSIKESDRSDAMMRELSKIGISFHAISKDVVKMDGASRLSIDKINTPFFSYNDHRIAMAIIPLCLKIENISIDNIKAVDKSYPGFWNDTKEIFTFAEN